MASISNITIEQLAQAFKSLSLSEKAELFDLLPEDWFITKHYELGDAQKEALDKAAEKKAKGNAVFHSWEDVEKFVRNKNER